MTVIFNGQKLAGEKEKKLAEEVAEFRKKSGITPRLVSIIVGNNPASALYLKLKQKAAERVGIEFEKIELTDMTEVTELIKLIEERNQDPKTHGIMVQLPFPGSEKVVGAIAPKKDVDGLTGESKFLPATVEAIMAIIKKSKIKTQKSKIVIVGAGQLVGKPLAVYLKSLGVAVTVCDEYTKDISQYTKQADILVSATGVPGLIKKEMVKKGAAVIDVGSPLGDIDFPKVAEVASLITPVPGGVGPLTVVCLLENLLQAARRDGKI